MKFITQFFRIFTGALFIFSGSVKLIDPVGTQIKMEEYFEVFAQAFHPAFEHLVDFALPIAVIMCVAEVVMGVALLLFYQMRINMWLFLLLMVFFTFLTGYTAMALYAKENPETGFASSFARFAGVDGPANINAVSDCGCFGDFIKLRPWESFLKDLILMVPTLFLFFRRNRLESEFKNSVNVAAVALSLIISTWVAIHAINHLPMFDFRPYKIGADIKANMQPSAPLVYVYTMERNGETKDFTEYPSDTTWKYKSMDVANPEAKPKITDYNVWNDDGDFTQQTFEGIKFFVIIRKADKVDPKSIKPIVSLNNSLLKVSNVKIEPFVLSSSDRQSLENLRHEAQLAIPYYYSDGVVLKTIMRSNVGLWMLKNGKVMGKWHSNDCPSIEEVIRLARS
jgi:uncharacterized membrane protein YphA (DoxX/SURF4 family)